MPTHQIKKYANRKMYDVTTKSYVTLMDIANLIEAGEKISITDNATGKDITQEIVSQLVGRVLDGEAKKLPVSVLIQLLRRGSDGLVDFSRKYVSFWQNALTYAEDELDKVKTLIGKGKRSEDAEEEVYYDQADFIRLLDQRIDKRLAETEKKPSAAIQEQLLQLQTGMNSLATRLDTLESILSQAMNLDGKSRRNQKA